ncbi:MAG: aminoacyl-tRNA hydrolase [Patescibacteria group bacterium]|nr:aminoacyl-tRNA hydrolase [Patescibacteria group bacterium]
MNQYLIVALGNPGEKYEHTRHNAGWILADLAFSNPDYARNSYASAGVAKVTVARETVQLVKPATFMNESGVSVEYFIKKENIKPENIIVIYDDIDLPIGKMKISFDRGSGGHNGIKSIEAHLGSREFIRIRIGISKVLENGELVKPNVLGNFEPSEQEVLASLAPRLKSTIETIVSEGKETAMTKFNM